MNTRTLVRLLGALALGGMLYLAYGSAWLAPAAQASQCPIIDPSKHIPMLRLPESSKHKEFAVQEKAGQLEVINTAAEPIYVLPITPTRGVEKQRISAKNRFTIQIKNAQFYLENAPSPGSDCIGDGGVPAGQPVPQNIDTLLVIQLAHTSVAVPVEITYIENPNYASQLSSYQKRQQMGRNYLRFIFFMGVILPLGGLVFLLICVAAVVVVAVQWNGNKHSG